MPAFVELLLRRWWLIVISVALALAAAGVYAWRQGHAYEATTTMYIHPAQTSAGRASPAAISSELSELSYGSLINTVVSIAQSRSTLASAAGELDPVLTRLNPYTTIATVRPRSFTLDISVDGPDRSVVVALVNRLSLNTATAVGIDFPTFALSLLDPASTSSQVRPRLTRDLVYAGLAGLILGVVLASLGIPTRTPATLQREEAQTYLGEDEAGPQSEEDILTPQPTPRPDQVELPTAGNP
jgi:capsular polysaccharide biosynthesis protein